jgi:hypothetical protein
MRHRDGRRVIVPTHPELDRGMLNEIIKESRIDKGAVPIASITVNHSSAVT